MTRISRFTTALSLANLKGRQDSSSESSVCRSYGMDFQDGGTYFQNSLSSENFTFVEQFEGCNPDVAYNILVDPNGNQNLCSDTNLTPADTNMLSTCPLEKNQLFSGSWSIVVISNNGDGAGLAVQRDFVLSVGPQSTSTVTPTVTVTSVTSPIVNQTVFTTSTSTTTLSPSTVTQASVTMTPKITVTPNAVTSYSTKTLLTITIPSYDFDIATITATETASCELPSRPSQFDRKAVIVPTVGPAASVFRSIHNFRRGIEKERFVLERAERLALVERAPDPQPLIVTETDTEKWSTITTISTGATITATITSEITTTVTATPPPIVVLSGKSIAPRVTSTAPTPTKTITRYTIATVHRTTNINHHTFTITTTVTPSATLEACKSAGGILF